MVSVSVCYFFYQPIDEKIKTWPLCFPAKENPGMVKALFDWPIVLQYDVKAKDRLISRKFSGTTSFNRAFVQPTKSHALLYPFNKPIKLLYFHLIVCCFCFVRLFSFQGHTKIALIY